MKVLVDTSVWSLALRRRSQAADDAPLVRELEDLLLDSRAALVGIIRQELLSGISDKTTFTRLKNRLTILEDEEVLPEDYIQAAEYCNECRSKGIQGSAVDFLLCAIAARNDWEIFTTDKDFQYYAKHLPIKLH